MTSLPLAGKVAIVTGSSRGIGAAIAARLASDGANVVVNYVNGAKHAEDVVNSINSLRPSAVAIKADAASVKDMQALLDQTLSTFGRVDILVLNAGIAGPLFLVKAAAPYLEAGSRVVFFSSSLTLASMVPPSALVYVASKGAIEQISRVLAKDLGARGITVNTISPGPVDTDLFRTDKSEQQVQFYINLHPLKRLGQTDDISDVVAFLARPESRWINGQNIRVNGGFVV